MFNQNRKIHRNHKHNFFSQHHDFSRFNFFVFMLILIITIPAVMLWQAQSIQMATLEYFDLAPTATPFAGQRATIGEQYFRTGDLVNAEKYFSLAVKQQPDNISYMYEYGLILIELDRNDEAVSYGEKMMQLAPNDPRGYALKANAISWDDPTEAIPVAVSGTEVDNQFAPLHGALATAYTRIGRYTEALREGDLAVRIDPYDANAHRSYSLPLIYTENYSGAIQQLEQAIAINPNFVGPYFELAALYRNPLINQPEYAVAIFNEILKIEPNNPRAYLRLCETYAAVGLFQEAETYCDSALEIDPNYASAYRMTGQLRYSRRNYEGAIEAFQKCQDLSITDPAHPNYDNVEIECIYILGLAHYYLKDGEHCNLAWKWLNIALNHPEAQGLTLKNILQGLELTTLNCPGYRGRALPTAIPPTPIPPTPIGGY